MQIVSGLEALWGWVIKTSWQGGVLVLLVLLVQRLLGKRLSPAWRHGLWYVVLIRLALPVSVESPVSVFNVAKVPLWRPVSQELVEPLRFHGGKALERMPAAASRAEPATVTEESAVRTPSPAVAEAGNLPGGAGGAVPKPAGSLTWSLKRVTGLCWLAGCLVLGLHFLWAHRRFAGQLKVARVVDDDSVRAVLADAAAVVGYRRTVQVLETSAVSAPALFGLLRHRLLLPNGMVDSFSPSELRLVFLHELAHLKRGDLLANWLMNLLVVLHWFNPLVWWAFHRVRNDCEEACDAVALRRVNTEERRAYGHAMVKLVERISLPTSAPGLLGILEKKSQMERRIGLIADFKKTSRWPVLALLLFASLGLIALTDAQNKTGAEKSSGGGSGAEGKSAGKVAASGTNSTDATSASADGEIIDPKTGLKFTVSKTIAGTNDVTEHQSWITMSPNGKFLLDCGRVMPLDGSPAFTLKELQGAGVESWSASWSPDGRNIAFNAEGIEVLPVSPETGRATGAVRKLLEEKGGWFRGKIYWSADSEQILFEKWNRRMEREVGTISLRDGRLNKKPDYADFGLLSPDGKTIAYSIAQGGIWAKPVSGGASRLARPCREEGLFDDVVAWTPDGQWVVSAVDLYWREEIHLARVSDGQNFDVFPPEAVGKLVGKSTDGKRLWFYRSSFDLQTTPKVVPISGGPALTVGPVVGLDDLEIHCWSSDSASLAVLGDDKEGYEQLWSIPLTGGERVRFEMESLGTNGLWLMSVSPDGQKLLYAAPPGQDQGTKGWDFYVAPVSLREGRPTGPATLAFKGWQNPNPGVGETMGTWSPDGAKIAMPHRGEHGDELWILLANGGKPIQITQTPDKLGPRSQWSPDGRRIAFNLIAADRELLQVIPAGGGTARTILSTPKGQSAPFGWAPDAKEVVVACDGTILGFAVTGGSARVILRLQDAGYENATWLGWSPDGQHLAFQGGKRGEASRLCLFTPSTGRITTLDNSPPVAWDFIWSPDSQMICCAAKAAVKTRPAGVIRELDLAEAVQKATPVAERKPTVANAAPHAEPIVGPVFTDNFDDGPSKHWRFQDFADEGFGPGRHAVENGELMLSHARAYLPGIDWADYIVTVRVCIKEALTSGWGILSIATRVTPTRFESDRMDRYGMGIWFNNNAPPYLLLGINYADPSNTLRNGELSRSPCSLVRDKWYTLEFEVRGQQLRGYLDGKLVIESTDGRLLKGGVWLAANRARALFDDFSVRQLPRTVVLGEIAGQPGQMRYPPTNSSST